MRANDIPDMEKIVFILAALACFLLADSEANNDVLVSKCSEKKKKDENMKCAHGFLKKIRHPSANCSHELKKFMECNRNVTVDRCYGDYIKTHSYMKEPIKRMADMKGKLHHFGRLLCGIDGPAVNTSGLPKQIADMLKCDDRFLEKGNECADKFHNKFKANMNSTDLCEYFLEAKICLEGKMKEYCTFEKPPSRDRFNPFCKDMRDPPPKAGAEKAFISVVLSFTVLGLCLLL